MTMASSTNPALQALHEVFTRRWTAEALVTDERRFSYAELHAQAAGIAAWLREQGCQPGDSIGLRLPNGWPFACSYLACLLGGFRFIPINPELPADDQAYIAARTAPRLVLDDAAALAAIAPLPSNTSAFASAPPPPGAVFFTSGTTGRPKGVCHSLDALIGNVVAFNQAMGLAEHTRQYHVLPMAYMAGCLNTLLSPWMAGGTVLLGPRFKPAEALNFWQRPLAWGSNAIWLTPTLAATLVRLSRDKAQAAQVGTQFEHIFCGTAPLPQATRRGFLATFGAPLQESYGMSEVLLVAAQTRAQGMDQLGVGAPLPGVDIRWRHAPDFKADELMVHTPWTLLGYLLEDGEGSPLIDGGMPSGDVAELGPQGLAITGRLKDLIIRGGLNVSPVAVENVMLREPGIREVAVVGVPDDFWGERIVACLVTDAGADTKALHAALHQRCMKELGDGMRPDGYHWIAALPRNATGKIQKHVLRDQLK